MMNMELLEGRVCDLCHHHQPSFYCSSDSAFLCSHCDSQVHSANFLVARHIRLSLCKSSSSSSSSSSTTKNHTTVTPPKANNNNSRSDRKTRDVLVNWCTKLGLGVSNSNSNSVEVIEVAKHAFEASSGIVVWPYRLCLAASLCLGLLKDHHHHHHHTNKRIRMLLKRLEEISGVPANSIMLAQSKLLKIINHHHHHLEEGWAES